MAHFVFHLNEVRVARASSVWNRVSQYCHHCCCCCGGGGVTPRVSVVFSFLSRRTVPSAASQRVCSVSAQYLLSPLHTSGAQEWAPCQGTAFGQGVWGGVAPISQRSEVTLGSTRQTSIAAAGINPGTKVNISTWRKLGDKKTPVCVS